MEALPGPFGPILGPKIQKLTKIQKSQKIAKSGPLCDVDARSVDIAKCALSLMDPSVALKACDATSINICARLLIDLQLIGLQIMRCTKLAP